MLSLKTGIATLFALIAFAANSVLCRWALGDQTIDAASFTVIRLSSGVLALLIILKMTGNNSQALSNPNWKAATMLFIYAICFSYAYISLDTGTGALILFGAVQLTMIFAALYSGVKLYVIEWVGLATAFSGFVYLVLPTISTPSMFGFILMTLAGIAWGIYTMVGRGSVSPLSDTANNFLLTLPFVVVLTFVAWFEPVLTLRGFILAALSGAIASGIGYSIWYLALTGLSVTQAAVSQLSVPIIAAIGGVLFASESISLRLVIASIIILGGILCVILGKYYLTRASI